jgi:hypothetical protein
MCNLGCHLKGKTKIEGVKNTMPRRREHFGLTERKQGEYGDNYITRNVINFALHQRLQ